jgi:cytosine/adenosine deaminase-related metal-dependent hydrolase
MNPKRLLLQQGEFLVKGAFLQCDVRIVGSIIDEIGVQLRPEKHEVVVPLNGLCVIPGLINSHDHLEFNLFSRLGHPPYSNYVDWSNDIQTHCKSQIREVLKVPLKYRLLWGAYKNIFSGVTTVVHHNDYYWRFRIGYPLEVYRPYSWIHSLRLENRDLKKLLTNDRTIRFIHLAEGIDSVARGELKELSALNGLSLRTIVVHGVGLTDEDIETIRVMGSGLVWCPASNLFLFGATAPIEKMLGKIPVALGSDSTLTGSLSLFDEMRVARKAKQLTSRCTLDLVTTTPAKMLSLNKGEIHVGKSADFLMFKRSNGDPFDDSINLSVTKVRWLWKNGRPIFGDIRLGIPGVADQRGFTKFDIDGEAKFATRNFPDLIRKIKYHAPDLELPRILPQ